MNKAIIAVAALCIVGAIGCGSSRRSWGGVPKSESVTDITPAPAPVSTYQPAPQPVAQPVVYDTMPSAGVSSGSIGSGSYTVKKGDTLYSIAKNRYGEGKQWNKIASANPGLRPETLKVGQTITIP